MNPPVVLISDDNVDDKRILDGEEELASVIIISDDDDDVEINLDEKYLESVVIISDDDGGEVDRNLDEKKELELVHERGYNESDDHEEEKNNVEKSVEEECLDNCDEHRDNDCFHQGGVDLQELSHYECKTYLREHGMRVTGTKDECIQRIKEHERLKDGKGESVYPRSSFPINCTGDACKGDVVLFKQKLKGKKRSVAGRIIAESYGGSNQEHTFSIEVLWSEWSENLNPLSILLVKGRHFYNYGTFRQPWENEMERLKVLEEKHSRGAAARNKRKLKLTEFACNDNRVAKRQKVSHIDKQKSTNCRKRESVYPRSSFSIDCTRNACKGDVVLFKQNMKTSVVGRILKGTRVGKRHAFAIQVLWTEPYKKFQFPSTLVVKDKNLYKFGTFRQPWKNETERSKFFLRKKDKAGCHNPKLSQTQIASKGRKLSHGGAAPSEEESEIDEEKCGNVKGTTKGHKRKASQKITTARTHKRKATRFQTLKNKTSTQPSFCPNPNPNPNDEMYYDHHLQEAYPSSFPKLPPVGLSHNQPPLGFSHNLPPQEFSHNHPPQEFSHNLSPQGFSHNLPPHGFSHNLPPQGFSHNLPPQGFSPNLPPHGYSHNLPPHGFSNNQPPQGFSNNQPPQGFSPNLPPQGFSPNLPPQGFPHNLPPQGFPHNLPPQGFPHNLPPQVLSHNLPPQGFSHNLPPQGFSHNLSPQGFSPNLPPQRFQHNLPPQGFPHNLPPQGFSHNLSPQGLSHNLTPQGLSHNLPPQGPSSHNLPPPGFPHNLPPQGFPYNLPPQGSSHNLSPQGFPHNLPPFGV